MRCLVCNAVLSPYESTRRFSDSEEYVDLCNECINGMDEEVGTFGRADLYDGSDEQQYGDDDNGTSKENDPR